MASTGHETSYASGIWMEKSGSNLGAVTLSETIERTRGKFWSEQVNQAWREWRKSPRRTSGCAWTKELGLDLGLQVTES